MMNKFKNAKTFGLSHPGKKRAQNEDSFGIDPESELLVVADGMGGHAAGEVASQTAIEEIINSLRQNQNNNSTPDNSSSPCAPGDDSTIQIDRTKVISDAVNQACRTINDLNIERNYREGQGMGTTVVGIWFVPEVSHIAIFHVGDSRAYRLRDGALKGVTRDHTLYQDWEDNGSEGPAPRKNIISRALGPWPHTKVDVHMELPQPGDVYLLCSDGLNGMLEDNIIESILAENPDIENAGNRLVEAANANGGKDNITVVLTKF